MAAAAIQLVPSPARENPPIDPKRTVQANVKMTPQVSAIVERACANCHSNATTWPWYARVAPVSWMVAGDVHDARHALNFSEWPIDAAGGIAALTSACVDLRIGRMPPPSYRLVHPESKVSAKETEAFCAWTEDVSSSILSGAANNK